MRRNLLPCIGGIAMAALILDGKTAVSAAKDAVQLCINVLIPSLFPFFVFSSLLAGSKSGRMLRPVAQLLRLPKGAESILLVSFLGGYPVGAAAAAQACKSGALKTQDGRRMLAFCSNAGPSFLFGIGMQIFPNSLYCWVLWFIHIASAILVGLLTPGGSKGSVSVASLPADLPQAVRQALTVMATVCGWVIIFRVLIGFLDRWALWAMPDYLRVLLCGILELANGCCSLGQIGSIGLKMVLFSGMLSFGGLCVWLQTVSVTAGLDASLYLPGKLTQASISILLCSMAQVLLPQPMRYIPPAPVLLACGGTLAIYLLSNRKLKNRGRNLQAVGV